ncbi:MAG: TolC family protein [Elusimicrobia bacterium]|nr:TolC family protein [Candidatus Liberimonas magnetica]
MITKFLRVSALLIMFLTVSHNLCGAEDYITLKKALAITSGNNTKTVNARKNVEIAKSKLVQTRAYPNPSLDFKTTDLSDPWSKDSGSYELTLNQEIEVFGKRGSRKSMAEGLITIASEELSSTWLEISLEVKERYYDLLLFKKRNEIARENLDLVRKLLDSVQVKYNSGSIYLNELLRAKIELSGAENELQLSQKEFRVAKAQFNYLIGKPVDYEFMLEEQLSFVDKKLTQDALMQKALSGNPELKARIALLELNKQGIKLARQEKLPTPTLGVIQTQEGQNKTLGASLGFSLPLWNINTGNIKEKEIELDKTENEVVSLKKQLELSVYDAYIEAESAAKQVSLLKKNVEEANEIQSLIGLQYKEGKAEFLTYLDNLKTVRNTKLGYYEAIVNYNKKLALIERLINEDM